MAHGATAPHLNGWWVATSCSTMQQMAGVGPPGGQRATKPLTRPPASRGLSSPHATDTTNDAALLQQINVFLKLRTKDKPTVGQKT